MGTKPPEQIEETSTGTQRELRQYALGDLDVDHKDIHPIAGLVDDKRVRSVLMFMAENYSRRHPTTGELIEEMPRSFWETDFARRAIRKYGTEQATQAIKNNNRSQMAYITGLPSYQSDVSGLHAINQLADWLIHSERCKLIYMAALMGRGKTDFACTCLQVIDDHYQRLRRSVDDETAVPEFAANFEIDTVNSDATVEEINNYDDLLAWAETGSSKDDRWYIFDEASTELTAQSGANAQNVAETMAPFVKKMRKLGVNMIVIGHDRGDIHVAIRSLADFVDKRGTKRASFYAGVNNRQPVGHLFDLDGIPETGWDYDTDDMAEWSWGSAVEDGSIEMDGLSEDEVRDQRNMRMARLYKQTDITQAEIAGAFDVSTATVSNACKSVEFEQSSPQASAD